MNEAPACLPYGVIVPAYNAVLTLGDAINSVLRQTIPPAAIVVVDDGSTDDTAAVAASFGDRLILARQLNAGPAVATDRGLGIVETPLVAGLDADDIWFPMKAERQIALLASRPDLDAAFCRSVSFDHGEKPDPVGLARDAWSRSTMMMRRTAAARMGPVFDPDNPRGLGEMIRWFDRGRRLGLTFEMMSDVLVGRRLIEGSLSFSRDPRALLAIIQGKLARRS